MTAFVNAIVFAAKGATLAVLHPKEKGGEPPLWAIVLSGNTAGLMTTAVGTPMELVKCRLQVQGAGGSALLYKGNVDCVRQVSDALCCILSLQCSIVTSLYHY